MLYELKKYPSKNALVTPIRFYGIEVWVVVSLSLLGKSFKMFKSTNAIRTLT